MSYTRTMHCSVEWYTSGSVHYPASESGGSVGYSASGSVPVTINVHVMTEPFDASVVGCNASLAALGGSVVAMNEAQCQAIQETSDTVSQHITGGFFSLVKSELSQNMASLFAKLNSGVMLVMEKTKLAVKQREVMQGDYSRALSRYTKVFNDLDEECRRRVEELDRGAMRLARDVNARQISESETRFAANAVTYTNDEGTMSTKLFAAYVKAKTDIIIDRIAQHITQKSRYSKQMASLLKAEALGESTQCGAQGNDNAIFVPVLYCASLDGGDKERMDENYYVCQADILTDQTRSNIEDCVKENISTGAVAMGDDIPDSVMKAFNAMTEEYLGQGGDDEKKRRVYNTMRELSRGGQAHKGE